MAKKGLQYFGKSFPPAGHFSWWASTSEGPDEVRWPPPCMHMPWTYSPCTFSGGHRYIFATPAPTSHTTMQARCRSCLCSESMHRADCCSESMHMADCWICRIKTALDEVVGRACLRAPEKRWRPLYLVPTACYLLFIVYHLPFIIYYLQVTIYYLLLIISCLQFIIYGLWFLIYYVLPTVGYLFFIGCDLWFTICFLLFIIYYILFTVYFCSCYLLLFLLPLL